MAISKAEKAAFNDEVKDIQVEIDDRNRKIRDILGLKKKLVNVEGYYNIELATYQLDIIDRYLKMNDLSMEMLGIRNSKFLDEGRKGYYKVLQYAEDTVGSEIDRSLKSNSDYLVKIDRMNPKLILGFVNRIHGAYSNLKRSVGESSKWKWSFVDIYARLAIMTKNITNFSDLGKIRDPRAEFYYDRRNLMDLCKESLSEAAKQLRTKYELSERSREDLKKSIDFLSELRKIHVIFGEDTEANRLKKTIDASKLALEAEDQSKEKKKKK